MFGYGKRHLGNDLAAAAGDNLTAEEKCTCLRNALDGFNAKPKIADHNAIELCILIGCRHDMGTGVRDLNDTLLRNMAQSNRELSVFANETLADVMVGKGDLSPEYDKFGDNAFAKNASQMFMQTIGSYPDEKRMGLGKRMVDQSRKTEVAQYLYHIASGLEELCEGHGALQKAFGSAFFEMATAGKTGLVSLYGYRGLKTAYENGYVPNSAHPDTILARLLNEEPAVVKAGAGAFAALARSFPELVRNKETLEKLSALLRKDRSGYLKPVLNPCIRFISQAVEAKGAGIISEGCRPENLASPIGVTAAPAAPAAPTP